jgi:uncharacterized membrane protein
MSNKPVSKRRVFLKQLWKYFLAGVTVLAPIVASIVLLVFIFQKIDNILQPVIGGIIRWFKPGFEGGIPGLGFITTMLLVIGAGVTASNYAGRKFIKSFEFLLIKLPVFKQVYLAAQQVTKNLAGSSADSAAFRRVVFIEFPIKGMICAAFVTNEILDPAGNRHYTLYVPTPPNPFSGYFIVAEAEKVIESKISVNTAFKMDLTAGILSPAAIDVNMPDAG